MAPRYNELIEAKVREMLDADITVPATLVWFFLVVIETKNTESQRLA